MKQFNIFIDKEQIVMNYFNEEGFLTYNYYNLVDPNVFKELREDVAKLRKYIK